MLFGLFVDLLILLRVHVRATLLGTDPSVSLLLAQLVQLLLLVLLVLFVLLVLLVLLLVLLVLFPSPSLQIDIFFLVPLFLVEADRAHHRQAFACLAALRGLVEPLLSGRHVVLVSLLDVRVVLVGDFSVLVLDVLSRVLVLDVLSRVFVLLQLVLVAA